MFFQGVEKTQAQTALAESTQHGFARTRISHRQAALRLDASLNTGPARTPTPVKWTLADREGGRLCRYTTAAVPPSMLMATPVR
jgi:hypothetical protein